MARDLIASRLARKGLVLVSVFMRITGGAHRSRELLAPRGNATRPTADRVREALFSILTSRGVVSGARVLDLFAGTGALALEALSRGAREAVCVEHARDALQALRANLSALGLERSVVVIAQRVERSAGALSGAFDLVFCDPPYALVREGGVAPVVAELAARGRFAPGAELVLEHDAKDAPPELAGFVLATTRAYGDTALTFYERSADDAPATG